MDYKIIENLKYFINNSHLTKQKIADISGISRQYIYKIINGDIKSISFDTIERLCKALNIEISQLLSFDKTQNNENNENNLILENNKKQNISSSKNFIYIHLENNENKYYVNKDIINAIKTILENIKK